jgi:hypothetical protein
MVNHWGIQVDPEVATTGVFQLSNLEHIWDEVNSGIDLAWEEHKKSCVEYNEDGQCDCEIDSTDYLIGFYQDEKTKMFEPDKEADFSAILRGDSNVIQVLRSKWGIRCALCSPCYPGQGDGDTPGGFLAFSIPPDVIGDHGYQKLKERIFLVGEEKK